MDLIRNDVQEVYSTVKVLSEILYKICKYGQYMLICLFYFLLITLSSLYIDTLSTIQKAPTENILYLIIGVYTIFSMVFNYTMCVMVKPGSPQDLEYNQISQIDQRCIKCYIIKPPRTHHCSMCNSCILQMDHHCPWIGQCVGHHNRSYFLNFLLYTQVGLVLQYFVLREYMSDDIYWKDLELEKFSPMLMMETYYFIVTLIVVLGLFNIFHWYLVFSGKTTLECCLNDPRYSPSNNFIYNLRLVFGTANPFLILLPKISVIKHKGFEWGTKNNTGYTSMIEIEYNSMAKSSSKRINMKK